MYRNQKLNNNYDYLYRTSKKWIKPIKVKLENVSYDDFTKALHWFFAISIIYITLSGYALHIITNHALHRFISTVNVSLATVLCLFFPIRVIWAFFRKALPPVKGTSSQQHAIAVFAHSLIYMLIFAVLATGYLMIPDSYSFFWLLTIPTPFHAGEATEFFFLIHRISCIALAGLVVMHVAAVVQHYVVHHINILKRML
jgi:cytochrome b561